MKFNIRPYTLIFNLPAGTSRGVLKTKKGYILQLFDKENNRGLGEVSLIPGLSPDQSDFLHKLSTFSEPIPLDTMDSKRLDANPALEFALEMAIMDLKHPEAGLLFPSKFTRGSDGIHINGLIWMGDKDQMLERIKDKLAAGYTCLKLKVGAIVFSEELLLLEYIRNNFSPEQLELRLDANGAFEPDEAERKLQQLSRFQIHSIEQPIAPGQHAFMANLCAKSPIPIALDEELIGIVGYEKKKQLLASIQPQFIILKPSLLGGFKKSQSWIDAAKALQIQWWVTSALESNIGLNAIAQWTYTLGSDLAQGLGTGTLYQNNIPSPLFLDGQTLFYSSEKKWEIDSWIS